MPVYTYRCNDCAQTFEEVRKIAHMDDPAPCSCGSEDTRCIIVPVRFNRVYGAADFPGYRCIVTDQWVDSRKKRRDIEREHNLQEAQ